MSLDNDKHVESIVLLSKLHTKQNIEVELEMSELDMTAAESKATYEEIKQYVLDKCGLKVSSLQLLHRRYLGQLMMVLEQCFQ